MIRAKISLTVLGLVLCVQAAAAATAAPSEYPVASDSGRIESLDFAGSTMVVGGMIYAVTLDTKVEINGSYGAFTMLRVGMPIHFDYLEISRTERRMVLIQELPPGVDPEET